MKTIHPLKLAIILSIAIISRVSAQEHKKISIYLEMEKNGQTVIVDTTFSTRAEMQSYLKSRGIEMTDIPEPPTPPVPPHAPNAPNAPELPEIPDLPELPRIVINMDDIELTKEEKAKIEKEIEGAKLELKQMKIDIEKSNKEIEKAGDEIKKMNIDIEKSEDNEHQKIIIRNISDDGSDEDKKIVIIRSGDVHEAHPKVLNFVISDEDNKGNEVIDVKSENEPLMAEENKTKDNPEAENYKLQATEFKIYPNPTNGNITVSFRTEKDGPVEVKLLDAAGRVIVNEQVQVSDGFFSKDYNIEGQSKGTYLLQLRQGDQWRHEKIVMR
jgi:hypothetical protein